jgi:hypothetical protein
MDEDRKADDPQAAERSTGMKTNPYIGMTPDEILRATILGGGPMAPDRPRGFVPSVHRDAIREAPIIFARLPNGSQVMLFGRVDGQEIELFDILLEGRHGDVPALDMPCAEEEDAELLRQLIREVKGQGPDSTT